MKISIWQYIKDLKEILCIVLVIVLTVIIFGQTIFFEFVYDDFPYLVANRGLQGTLNPISYIKDPGLGWAGSDNTQVYRPLGAFLYALEFRVFGFDPFYYHLIKIILHALNVILAGIVLFLLFRNRTLAALSSLIFLVHPVNVEAIAWVSQQSTLAATALVLASLIFFLLYDEYRLKTFLVLSWGFALLAPFMKDQLIVVPFFLLGCLLYLKIPWRRSFWLAVSYFLTAAPFLWIRYSIGLPFNQAGGWFDNRNQAILTMIHGLAYYIRLIFVPYPLTVNYEWFPVENYVSTTVILSASVIGFCIFIAFYFYKRAPEVTIGIYWFFAGLIPVNNVVTPIYTYINERYLYVSSLGMIVAFVYMAHYYIYGSSVRKSLKNSIFFAFIGIIFLIFAYMTLAQLPVWRNSKSLWGSALSVDYNNLRNFTNYSSALQKEGNYLEALTIMKSAVRLEGLPSIGYKSAYRSLITASLLFGDTRRARHYLIEGLTRYPDDVGLKLLEIKYYFAQKNYKKAEEISSVLTEGYSIEKARKEPALYEIPFFNLIAVKMLGDEKRAQELTDRVGDATARQNLASITDARVFMLKGENNEALEKLLPVLSRQEIAWLDPYIWLGQLYESRQEYLNATYAYQVALYKNPTYTEAVLGFERALKASEQ